jgi:hypothetical protein
MYYNVEMMVWCNYNLVSLITYQMKVQKDVFSWCFIHILMVIPM